MTAERGTPLGALGPPTAVESSSSSQFPWLGVVQRGRAQRARKLLSACSARRKALSNPRAAQTWASSLAVAERATRTILPFRHHDGRCAERASLGCGRRRADLLARLAGFTIELPPLRSRRMDLGLLIASLLQKGAARADAVTFTPEAGEAFLRYDWPSNTRELEQALSRALVLAGAHAVDVAHLPRALVEAPAPKEAVEGASGLNERDARLRLERLAQLASHGGNLADVARAMNKARMQIHRWCKRFGIDPNVYRR